jgi:CRP-like cAMP-binding protein
MGVELFRAQSEHDQEELFRFRYAVYVEELGRYRQSADHRGRRLVEPEDAHSVLYGARQGGHVVGTARLTFGADGLSHRQIDQYSLGHFLAEVPAELIAVGERLMVAPDLRGSTVSAELRDFEREDISARGVRMIFGACEPHLLSMYLSAGVRTYAEHNINSEEAGYLIPLVWLEGDPDALPRSIQEALRRSGAVHSASLMPPGEYRAQMGATLERLDQEELHAFSDFEHSEAQDFISRSTIIECARGDRVLKEGGSSRNLFLVLNGILEVRHQGRLINVLEQGDVFGEMAFLLGLPRQSDVYAATPDVRVLSLSDGTLRKLMAEEPPMAAKLLFNISRMLCGRLIKANAAPDAG